YNPPCHPDPESPMNEVHRRDVLKALLGGTLQAAAAVILARAVPAADAAVPPPAGDPLDRADRAAESLADPADDPFSVAVVSGGFRNAGGGGFRNGGFVNGGGGGAGFRNGGFVNGGGGGFRNTGGAFRNTGGGVDFRNAGGAGFHNGGFDNGGGGFRNGSF